MGPHQPRDAMAADVDPVGAQLVVNPRTAIPSVSGAIAGADMGEQPQVLTTPSRRALPTPGIQSTAGDVQHATHDRDGIVSLLRLNEPIPQGDSLAKKATAFFRMSR